MANALINSLGGFSQLGMVVKDAEATMRYLSETLGIGPFFVMSEITVPDFQFRGKPSPSPVLTIGFGQAGPVQLEIIQQHNDVPTAYTEFLDSGREGAQHLSIWFSDCEAYTEARRKLQATGLTIVHEAGAEAPARFAYFESAIPGGLMVEIAEARTPASAGLFDSFAEAARSWDGRDPLRQLG